MTGVYTEHFCLFMKGRGMKLKILIVILFLFCTLYSAAEDGSSPVLQNNGEQSLSPDIHIFTINNIWMMICTFLVFIMHLGFATLEAGLTRAKNTVNILFKNTLIVAIGILTYSIVGFSLMYPGTEYAGRIFGFAGWGLSLPQGGLTSAYNPGYTYWSDFIFQGMFAATAATIISGAVAERIKLSSFLIFATVYVAFVYPVAGMWTWGGGWLAEKGFHDFAGSTMVHSVGGWGALAGVILLGPRLGKYVRNTSRPIMGHSMPLAAIGVFLLWFGWFGFNGGSVLSADPGCVSYVFVTTTIAACAGIVTAMFSSWCVQKKPDLSMVLNGCLAGLVGITAGADTLSLTAAVITGGIAGIVVVLAVLGFDRIRVDDPVGALSVHLVCGVWGTLAVGLFSSSHTILTQLIGVLAAGVLSFGAAFVFFWLLKVSVGIRVDEEEELKGLDIGEHGMEAYAGFQIFTTQ